MEKVRDHLEVKTETVECFICNTNTSSPKFNGSLLERRSDYPFEKYCFCANCVLDNHENHHVSATVHVHLCVEWYSLRDTTAEIMKKLLRKKLYVEEDKIKCRLRYKRMMLTSDELIKLLKNPYCYIEDKIDAGINRRFSNREGTIKKTLTSLITQYEQFQELDSVCQCVDLWKDVVRLNIFDFKERSPHFHSMADKAHLEKKFDVCPYQLPTSSPEKRSLLKVIKEGKPLTQPFKMDIFREVRRGRYRNVYCFPTRRDEVPYESPEDKEFNLNFARYREEGEAFLENLKALRGSAYDEPGHLIYPERDGNWRVEEHVPWNLRGAE